MEKRVSSRAIIIEDGKLLAMFRRKIKKDGSIKEYYVIPGGGLEEGETLEETAIRETAEETKRVAQIVPEIEPVVERYQTPAGEKCACYMFVAIDKGHSNNDSWDTHDTYFIDVDKVEEKLTYEDLKQSWKSILPKIKKLF